MTVSGVEYADENITVYSSCPFHCKYCWANSPLWRYRIRHPHPLREAERLSRARKSRTIVVSFMTDVYQPLELEQGLTRRVLEVLSFSKVLHRVLILTKNPMLALERDGSYNMRGRNVWLGSTVTALDSIPDEPNAPGNPERLEALQLAHQMKIVTWMSIEPWIPNVTDPTAIIKESHRYIDWYVLGKLNYAKSHGYKIPQNYYKTRLPEVVKLLDRLGKPFLIKKELLEEAGIEKMVKA